MHLLKFLLAGLVAASALARAESPIQGTGATFPSRVYLSWAASYAQASGQGVAYSGTGSGQGLQRITAREVDFGASDVALTEQELKKRSLVQIPSLVGAVVPVVSLPGLRSGELVLDGPALYGLMSGAITRWNDARVQQLNPRLSLPDLPVRPVVRAEKSGTTMAFTRYLALVATEMRGQMEAAEKPVWPGQPLAVEGNDGMVDALRDHPGAIGYVSYDRVLKNQLVAVALRTADGATVSASEDSMKAAIRASESFRLGDERASLLNLPHGAWPISVATFLLVDAQPKDATAAARVLRFIYWVFLRGDRLVAGTGFVPLPAPMQAKLAGRLDTIQAADGKRIVYVTD